MKLHDRALNSDFSGTDRAVDCCHVTGIWVDVHCIYWDLGFWNQLFIVVGLQIPDMNDSALVSDNQLRLNRRNAVTNCAFFSKLL